MAKQAQQQFEVKDVIGMKVRRWALIKYEDAPRDFTIINFGYSHREGKFFAMSQSIYNEYERLTALSEEKLIKKIVKLA